jgi:adenine deaminase
MGVDVFKVLRVACVNPVLHYHLDVGLLRKGDAADFIIAEDLVNFNIIATYIDGMLTASGGTTNIGSVPSEIINHFNCDDTTPVDFAVKARETETDTLLAIEALDGQLITNKVSIPASALKNPDGFLTSNTNADILKIVVINRYKKAPIATAWIKNFGFKKGAIASTVAHDSHNIIAVAADDKSLSEAVNLVIKERGGISCVSSNHSMVLPLPVGGLMSNNDAYRVAKQYTEIDKMAKDLGSRLSAPFMTLSFMALLVIPSLKLSDKGLFDGDHFKFI